MRTKEVYFNEYCEQCEHSELPAELDPCNMCLTQGWNEDSHKPLYFKKKEKKHGRRYKNTSTI